MLEKTLTARSPLSDCTNSFEARHTEKGSELKKSNKGYWKRRAQQPIAESYLSIAKTQEESTQGGLKRGRGDMLTYPMTAIGNQPTKKRKWDGF